MTYIHTDIIHIDIGYDEMIEDNRLNTIERAACTRWEIDNSHRFKNGYDMLVAMKKETTFYVGPGFVEYTPTPHSDPVHDVFVSMMYGV